MPNHDSVGEERLQNEFSDRANLKPASIENLVLATCEAVVEKCEELESLAEKEEVSQEVENHGCNHESDHEDVQDVLEADSEAEVE